MGRSALGMSVSRVSRNERDLEGELATTPIGSLDGFRQTALQRTMAVLPWPHRLRQMGGVPCKGDGNETGAVMSQYYKQMQRGSSEAKRLLQERLARKEIGEAAYDEAASYSDDRAFKAFGIVFIAVFALVVLGVVLLGY